MLGPTIHFPGFEAISFALELSNHGRYANGTATRADGSVVVRCPIYLAVRVFIEAFEPVTLPLYKQSVKARFDGQSEWTDLKIDWSAPPDAASSIRVAAGAVQLIEPCETTLKASAQTLLSEQEWQQVGSIPLAFGLVDFSIAGSQKRTELQRVMRRSERDLPTAAPTYRWSWSIDDEMS